MPTPKSKEIVVADTNTGLASIGEIPEFLRNQIGNAAGMEEVEQNDLLLPRLGLCQSLSPQRRKSDAAYIPELKEGDLFNTVTKEIYGEQLEVIALFFFKNRIKYNPIDQGGGIDCISVNGVDGGRISPDGCSVCKFSVWGNGSKDEDKNNDHPDCTLYHNFMAFIPHTGSPIAISYKSTGLKISKEMLAGVRITRLPMYAKKYVITVTEMKANNNVWYEKKLIPNGFVDPDTFKAMEAQFESLKQMNIQVDTTGESGDTSFDIDGKNEAF